MMNSIILWINDRKYYLIGIVILIAGWQILALLTRPIVIPAPIQTLKALGEMVTSGVLFTQLYISLKRQLVGLLIGVVLGTSLGVIGGLNKAVHEMVLPLINTIMATPNVIFVVMAMVWFGVGSIQVVFVVALMVFPVMYINSVKGLHTIDQDLLEMAEIYRIPMKIKILKIYLPGLVHGFLAGFTLSAATSIRVTVMAELFGSQDGIGQAIVLTRSYLETDKLFAWALTLILIVVILETLILKPLEVYIQKWQG